MVRALGPPAPRVLPHHHLRHHPVSAGAPYDGMSGRASARSSEATVGAAEEEAASLTRRLRESVAAVQALRDPAAAKDPLSLVITTANLRAFVAKASPVFWVQDTVEATLRWDDWAWSAMCMALWAAIAYYPRLLLAAPTVTVAFVLHRTHHARYPSFCPPGRPVSALAALLQPREEGPARPPVVPTPVTEGSIRYLANLRDIQNMCVMKLVPDGWDGASRLAPYLNWSDPETSRLLLQLSVVASVMILALAPWVPVRLILLMMGEGPMIMGHPWVRPLLPLVLAQATTAHARRIQHATRELALLDRLPDAAWQNGWSEAEMYENQRFAAPAAPPPARAGTTNTAPPGPAPSPARGTQLLPSDRASWTRTADGWSPPGVSPIRVASSLPHAWVWAEEDWRVDTLGLWSSVGADASGWVYTDTGWRLPAAEPYGHDTGPATVLQAAAQPGTSTTIDAEAATATATAADTAAASTPRSSTPAMAVTRRRRWTRRCMRAEL